MGWGLKAEWGWPFRRPSLSASLSLKAEGTIYTKVSGYKNTWTGQGKGVGSKCDFTVGLALRSKGQGGQEPKALNIRLRSFYLLPNIGSSGEFLSRGVTLSGLDMKTIPLDYSEPVGRLSKSP